MAPRDLSKVERLFASSLIEPVVDTKGWLTASFGVLFLHARIDIAAGPSPELDEPLPLDCGPYAEQHLQTIRWRGFDLWVPPLELHLNANRQRKRTERVKKIEAHLLGG